MPRTLPRWLGPTLTIASILGLCVSSWSMAQRLKDRPALKNRPHYWFNTRIEAEKFKFLGHDCEVTLDPPPGAVGGPDPNTGQFPKDTKPALIVHWRGQQARFEFGGRYDPRLPNMLKHEEWFKLLPMAASEGGSDQDVVDAIRRGEIKPRLIAAARYPAEGYDEGSWGLVRRREWGYRFAEFLPDGPAEQSIRQWETTYKGIERVVAPGPYDKPVEGLSEEQRREILWQYDAMIQVTPSTLFRAKDKVVTEGMAAMSWTWPAAGLSVMGIVVGVMLTFSAGVNRRP